MPDRLTITITGPQGSGKTRLAEILQSGLSGRPIQIPEDLRPTIVDVSADDLLASGTFRFHYDAVPPKTYWGSGTNRSDKRLVPDAYWDPKSWSRPRLNRPLILVLLGCAFFWSTCVAVAVEMLK